MTTAQIHSLFKERKLLFEDASQDAGTELLR
jgi:hypothetical protein